MRIVGRTEYERERRTGSNHGPVRRRVQPSAPYIRPLDLAAIEMNHRRVKFSRSQLLRYRLRRRLGHLISLMNFFGKGSKRFRGFGDVYVFAGHLRSGPSIVSHSVLGERDRIGSGGKPFLPAKIIIIDTYMQVNAGLILVIACYAD